jgi:hypothetical protein
MRRIAVALFVAVAAAWAVTCGSSSQTVTSPSTTKCAVTATATPTAFPAAGGSGTLSVATNRECQWSVAAGSGWIQLGSGTSGQGDASVPFSVAANADPAGRKGDIIVGGQQVGITQDAAPCVFTVSPRNDSINADGGRKSLSVTANSSPCAWTAQSNADWLTIVSGAQGTGNGQVTYEARGTTGPTRSGTLLVAGQAVTITQSQGCSISLAPTSQNVAANGGTGTIVVTTAVGCQWSAQSDSAWIAVTSGQSGTGAGSVTFSVNASNGPARTGTVTVGGYAFTITQASGCQYTIDPVSQSIPAAGASGTINVHSGAGCQWTASSSASWLSISSGATGSGNGSVQFAVPTSTGPARSATITIGGQAATIDQASGCTYALVPTSQTFADWPGSTGSFTVNTSAGCTWTAISQAQWITIASGSSGSGNGTVSYAVEGNPMGSAARTGTIAVNNQTFTVNQNAGAACVYTLSPTSQGFSAGGGSGGFTVTTVLTCPWYASSNDSWITVTSYPSGVGNGYVTFSVAQNPAGSGPRVGTIDVRGQIFTVTQAGGSD